MHTIYFENLICFHANTSPGFAPWQNSTLGFQADNYSYSRQEKEKDNR